MSNIRRVEKTVRGKVLIFNYPTLLDQASIENEIFINGRGQIAIMLMNPDQNVVDAANTIIMLATMKYCVKYKEGTGFLIWDRLYDDEKEFLKEAFDLFEEWRLSFRNKTKEDDSGDEKKNS